MSKTNETPKTPDLWERICMLLSMPEAQAAIRTDMEFSVSETKYILERLHKLKRDILKQSKSGYEADIRRGAVEELAAEIAVVEKASALSENGKYVISMDFREMDAFFDAFKIEWEAFKRWTYIEIYQKKQYVDVVTDIYERFNPVYNQRWNDLMSHSTSMPVKAEVEDADG